MALRDDLSRIIPTDPGGPDAIEHALFQALQPAIEETLAQVEALLEPLAHQEREALIAQLSTFFETHTNASISPQGKVHLHWQHSGQIYLKSADVHSDYRVSLPASDANPPSALLLRVASADAPRDISKVTGLRYRLSDPPVSLHDDVLTVWFDYTRDPNRAAPQTQRQVDAQTTRAVLAAVPESWRARLVAQQGGRSRLARALSRFTSRETVDTFVHPDLGSALRPALDPFLASRLDLDSPDLQRLQVARDIGEALISLRSLLEDARHNICLKRRFVLLSRWLIPQEEDTIVDTDGWDAVRVWDALSEHAVDLSCAHAGTFVHGNNRDALNLVGPRLTGRLMGVYLDPPYNTGVASFRYTDDLERSTWLTAMQQVLSPLAELAIPTAFLWVSIDENEVASLMQLGAQTFGETSTAGLFSVRVRHEDRVLTEDKEVHEVIEYAALFRLGADAWATGRQVRTSDEEAYCWHVSVEGAPEHTDVLGGKIVSVYKPGTYTIENKQSKKHGLKRINIRGTLRRANSSGRFYVAHMEPALERYQGCVLKVPDMGADGLGHRWFWIPPADHRRKNPDYFQGVPLKRKAVRRVPHPTFIDLEPQFNRVAREGGVDFRDGKKPIAFLHHLLTIAGLRERQEGWVADLFAGSGSTAEAVMRLNMEDGGRRRTLLAEVGDHAETVTIPRLKHAAAAAAGTDIPRLQQVLVLESNDDALRSILAPDETPHPQRLGIRFVDGHPTLSTTTFFDPWGHTLAVRRGGQWHDVEVDLVETFVHLLGLDVHHYATLGQEGLVCVVGTDPSGTLVVAVWRRCEDWPAERLRETVMPLLRELEPSRVYINGPTPSWPQVSELQPTEPTFLARMFPYGAKG